MGENDKLIGRNVTQGKTLQGKMSPGGNCYRGKNIGENVTKGKTLQGKKLQGKMFQGKTAFPPLVLPQTFPKVLLFHFLM